MQRNSSYLSRKRGCWPISYSVSQSRPRHHSTAEGRALLHAARRGGGGEAGAAAGAPRTATPRRGRVRGGHPGAPGPRPSAPPPGAPSALEGRGPPRHVRLPRGQSPLGCWWQRLRSHDARPGRELSATVRVLPHSPPPGSRSPLSLQPPGPQRPGHRALRGRRAPEARVARPECGLAAGERAQAGPTRPVPREPLARPFRARSPQLASGRHTPRWS